MQESAEEVYMTVGELADKVGVTVRTIQYYDQADLLKPSAKVAAINGFTPAKMRKPYIKYFVLSLWDCL